MKRFTSIELAGLTLGVILFLSGLISVIRPQSGVVAHFTDDAHGMSPRSQMEVVSLSGARLYGILGMLLGTGITIFSVYRGKA